MVIQGSLRALRRSVLVAGVAAASCSSTTDEKSGRTAQAVTSSPMDDCTFASFGGREYWFCDAQRNQVAAAELCSAAGLHLVRVDDAAENLFISQRSSRKTWLGATAIANVWSWQDGTAFWSGGRGGEAVDSLYSRWGHNQPNNDDHHGCAGLDPHDEKWGTWSCSSHAAFVCESEPVATPPDAPDSSCALQELDGKHYWFCTGQKTFDEARASCRRAGTDLAAIESGAENQFVAEHLAVPSFVGLSDQDREGAWKWLATQQLTYCAGTGVSNQSYVSWAANQPKQAADCEYSTRDGHGYWSCNNSASWNDARLACSGIDMALAEINDGAENAFLAGNVGNVWLGGSDAGQEGTWTWLSGGNFWASGPVAGVFSNWSRKQPAVDNASNCLSLNKDTWEAADCSGSRGFACEGATPREPQAPDILDCAVMNTNSGAWMTARCDVPAAYVCEPPSADAGKSLDELALSIRDDYRSGKPRVSDVLFRSEANVANPFQRYHQRFGMRECVDDLEPEGPATNLPNADQTATLYRQTYRGIPVSTRGYSVRRDSGGRTLGLTGVFEHDIDVDVEPALSWKQALERAFDALGIAQNARKHISVPEAQPTIYPTSQGPKPSWQLAYAAVIPETTDKHGHTVVVSAIDGHVISEIENIQRVCQSQTIGAGVPQVAEIEVNAYQQEQWLDRNDAAVSFLQGAPVPYLLRTNGVSTDPSSPLYTRPELFAVCPNESETDGTYAAVETDSVSVDENATESEHGAAFYMALQRCLQFMASDLHDNATAARNKWIGWDGTGEQAIALRLFNISAKDPTGGPYYAPDTNSIYFSADIEPPMGATTEVACHELAHGIWRHAAQQYLDLEMAAMSEGFSDMFGEAAEMWLRGHPGDGSWCFAGDERSNVSCLRNLKDPRLSTTFNCQVESAGGGILYQNCPSDFRGPDYCTLSAACTQEVKTDCCSPHRNSTILSHWFYLAANGQEGVNGSACQYQVPPADPDLHTAVTNVVQTTLNAIRNPHLAALGGFQGLAAATISQARNDFGGTEAAQFQAISRAWFAVNVTENLLESELPKVVPAREAKNINPWMHFYWPLVEGVTDYDVQISRGPFDGGPIEFEKRNILAQVINDSEATGLLDGFLHVALPYDSADRWFWRVRPHSTDDWANCYPIHSFVGTRSPDEITSISIEGERVGDAYRPGVLNMGWEIVDGVDHYELTLSTRDIGCQRDFGDDVIKFDIDPFSFGGSFRVSGVQPSEHYYVGVRAAGPKNFSGETAYGDCVTLEFDTTAMRPPELLEPAYGEGFYYPGADNRHPVWKWGGLDGPSEYRLDFYEIEEVNGLRRCESEVAELVLGDYNSDGSPCSLSRCTEVFDELLFPTPNPMGYCWTATSIAKNGEVSLPSEVSRFYYIHDAIRPIEPGVPLFRSIGERKPGVIPGDSYDQDVTLSWEAADNVKHYVIKLGQFPWGDYRDVGDWPNPEPLPVPEPSNCWWPNPDSLPHCFFDPKQVTFRGVTSQTSITVPKAEGGKGRYCYDVWPVLNTDRQPFVEAFSYCYTTGPAQPQVEFFNYGKNVGDCSNVFVADWPDEGPIKGEIRLPYVPDGQVSFSMTDDAARDVVMTNECEPSGPFFSDYYDCRIKLELDPVPGAAYAFAATTYSSDAHGSPVMDETTQVHCEYAGLRVGLCGEVGQPCCSRQGVSGEAPRECVKDAACDFKETDKCVHCGMKDQLCCEDEDNKCDRNLNCGNLSLKCEPCGGPGERCCFEEPDAECRVGACNDDFVCCEAPEEAPVLLNGIEDYQTFCPATDEPCEDWGDGLCVTKCKFSDSTYVALVKNHTIPCFSNMFFEWEEVPGAEDYSIYIKELNTSLIRTDRRESTKYVDTSVVNHTATPLAYNVIVRGRDACGAAGDGAIGMFVIHDTCDFTNWNP